MTRPSRRRFLKAVGATAMIGTGPGCTGIFGDDSTVDSDGPGDDLTQAPQASITTETGLTDDITTGFRFGPVANENTIQVAFDPGGANEPLEQDLPGTPIGEEIGITFDRLEITPTTDAPFDVRIVHTNARPVTLPDLGLEHTPLTVAHVERFNIENDDIESATIHGSIDSSLLEALQATPGDLHVVRFGDGRWQPIELSVRESNEGMLSFEATLPGFSWLYFTAVPGPVDDDVDLTPPVFESVDAESHDRQITATATVTDATSGVQSVRAHTWQRPDQPRQTVDVPNRSGDRYSITLPETGRFEYGDNVYLVFEAEDTVGNTSSSAGYSFLQPVRPEQFPHDYVHDLHGASIDGVSVTLDRERVDDRRYRLSTSIEKHTVNELYGTGASRLFVLYPGEHLEIEGNPHLQVDGAISEELDTALFVHDLVGLVSLGASGSARKAVEELLKTLAIDAATSFLRFDEPPGYTTIDGLKALVYDFSDPRDIARFDSVSLDLTFRLRDGSSGGVVTVLPDFHGIRTAIPENAITSTVSIYPYEFRRQHLVDLPSEGISEGPQDAYVTRSGWGSTGVGEFTWASSTRLRVGIGTVTSPEYLEFDTDRDAIRMRNVDTDEQITMQYAAANETWRISSFSPSPYDPAGEIVNPRIGTAREGYDHEWLDVTVDGDEEMFTRSVFARYTVEVIRDGEVVVETEPRLLSIGYEYEFGVSGDTVFATRHDEVKEEWTVIFELHREGWEEYDPVIVEEVDHSDNQDVFSVSSTDWNVDLADHEADFLIYEDESDAVLAGLFIPSYALE